MGKYITELARKMKGQGKTDDGMMTAEYVSASAIKIGGKVFSHGIHVNPECTRNCSECGKTAVKSGDTVLVSRIGNDFFVICKVV